MVTNLYSTYSKYCNNDSYYNTSCANSNTTNKTRVTMIINTLHVILYSISNNL